MGGLHQFARPLWTGVEVIAVISILKKLLPKDWRGEEPLDRHGDVRRLASVTSPCIGDLVNDGSCPLGEREGVGDGPLSHYRSPTPNQPASGLHLVHTLPISAELATCRVIERHDSQYCHILPHPSSDLYGTLQ